MNALLVISHGSSREQSNTEVKNLCQLLPPFVQLQFDFVQCAFLELAEPSIAQAIETCIKKGALEMLVLPYFLSDGRHVAVDIPKIISTAKAKYPKVKFTLATHLGGSKLMLKFVAECALNNN
jgi:sirohydrochlorin ferrochelatase